MIEIGLPEGQALLSIGPVVPLIVAEAPEKETVPKSANGRTPLEEEGASVIHSADDLFADLSVCEVLNVVFVVTSVSVRVNLLDPVYLTSPDIWSPGLIFILRSTGELGYISYQA